LPDRLLLTSMDDSIISAQIIPANWGLGGHGGAFVVSNLRTLFPNVRYQNRTTTHLSPETKKSLNAKFSKAFQVTRCWLGHGWPDGLGWSDPGARPFCSRDIGMYLANHY